MRFLDDTVYNVKTPTECGGIAGTAICIKMGIDGICNPDSGDKDEE